MKPQAAQSPCQDEMLHGLPGADRIRQGLEDIRAGRRSIAACLVRMARPRLSRANLMPPAPAEDDVAELELYRMFASEGSNAHSRYNALVRELISFEHALDHRMSRQLALPGS